MISLAQDRADGTRKNKVCARGEIHWFERKNPLGNKVCDWKEGGREKRGRAPSSFPPSLLLVARAFCRCGLSFVCPTPLCLCLLFVEGEGYRPYSLGVIPRRGGGAVQTYQLSRAEQNSPNQNAKDSAGPQYVSHFSSLCPCSYCARFRNLCQLKQESNSCAPFIRN